MLWRDDNATMQVIKFDGNQMMLTICKSARTEFYTILANRVLEDEITSDAKQNDYTSFNRLILQGRRLKVFSKHNLNYECDRKFQPNDELSISGDLSSGISIKLNLCKLLVPLILILNNQIWLNLI
jgi:hypothetical protein